ncbi:MAG: general stress protein [Chloroflexota bacterium]|nr:general stress protein [Chloroflexota bacterium]
MAINEPLRTSAATGRHTVAGLFDGPNHAEQALNDLKAAGFSPDQVSVVAKDTGATRSMVEQSDMEGAETTGAGAGALLGGLGGGALGWLVGIGALAIPGIGPIVAAGALATTLGGAAVGAMAGGLIGALAGAGIPEEDARDYQEHVRAGSILLTVGGTDATQAGQAREVFDRHGAAKVGAYTTDDGRQGIAGA